MLDVFNAGFQNFARNIRLVDFFDVVFVTVFIYVFLRWLLKTTSRRSVIGIAILVGIYILARVTNMYLTEFLIQILFVFIIIGIIIVFQSDIRRMIDRMGNWKIFGKQTLPQSNRISDVITEATSKMADNKTGALIVLKGKEDWDRHINGGIELNGTLSIPLLHSIFNTKAPGHDGAILLEGNKIVRFGTHLPLSTNLGKRSAGGTRHAAALGLSELCDALVIVVSEERGIASVAQSGKLTELETVGELKKIIDDYWGTHYEPKNTTPIEWWEKRNLRVGLASLIIAVLLWLGLAYQSGTVFRTYAVPIEYRNIESSSEVLRDSLPLETRITLSGSEQAFRTLDPSQLIVSFNMAPQNISSDELVITPKNITLPTGISLSDANPPSLNIQTRNTRKIELPIKVPTTGKLKENLKLIAITPRRKKITLLADRTKSTIPDSIATEAVDLSTISASDSLKKKIVLVNGLTLPPEAKKNITITIDVQQ